jgi:hypothetical protein
MSDRIVTKGLVVGIIISLLSAGLDMSFAEPQQDRARDFGPPVDFDEMISPETIIDYIRMSEAEVTKEEVADVEALINSNLPAMNIVGQKYLSNVGLQHEIPSVQYYGYRNVNPPSNCELTLENAFLLSQG